MLSDEIREIDIQVNERGYECKCGAEGERGTCPYSTEINDNYEECICCEDCRHECAMDI
jgi:hypothetical protein